MNAPWNSIYCIPKEKKKRRKRPNPRDPRELNPALRKAEERIRKLESKQGGYRDHIASLHAEIERLRDPSIPKRSWSHIDKLSGSIVRARGLKLTRTEEVFVAEALNHGYEIYRSGWPDFLIKNKHTGEYRFIEVKSPSDRLSDNQLVMFAALENLGIVVEVFRGGKDIGKRCSSWRVAAGLPENGSGGVMVESRSANGAIARSADPTPIPNRAQESE